MDASDGRLMRTLEGHTGSVVSVTLPLTAIASLLGRDHPPMERDDGRHLRTGWPHGLG